MSIIDLLSVFFLTFVQLSQGKFLKAVCRGESRYCVQQNSKGTWCYSPEAIHDSLSTSCTGDTHVELQGALHSHLKQNLSIAYYNGVDNKRLGGVDYAVPTASDIVRMCLSNAAGDGILQTLCFNVAGDNSIAGYPSCLVYGGPPVVTDGCYPENLNTNATTANTPTYFYTPTHYSSTALYPLNTHYSSLASAIVAPFVMAIFSVILCMGIGM